ncbi:MAG TPA: DUF6308 family protein [Streptosporangiaceae bacterium]|nr:DUF6308 family protein [Streptosporangiaceae bacterium]
MSDAGRGARRLREGLAAPGLPGALAAYFDLAEGFAGMIFTSLGHNACDEVTAEDLLAVSLLDIAWRPGAVRMLLGEHAGKVSGLLAPISSDLDLWDASDGDLATVCPLWDALRDMPGVGTATAAKLLARKRPSAVPGHRQGGDRAGGSARPDLGRAALPPAGPGCAGRGRGAAPSPGRRRQPAADPRRGDLDPPQPLPCGAARAPAGRNDRGT